MSDSNSIVIKYCKKCQCETERYATGACKPCNKKASNTWKAENRDRVKAINTAYRAANPEKLKAAAATWYASNTEKKHAKNAAWHAANPGRKKEIDAAWRLENIERCRAKSAGWAKANPEAKRIHNQNRHARKRDNGGSLSVGVSAKLFKLQRGKCACCSLPLGDDYHLDHIDAVSTGGMNVDSNMQLLRKICNLQKYNKHPIDFMQSRGFLL